MTTNSSSIQLPPLCIRSLNDKVFDNKKRACRQIEILTKELNTAGNGSHIKELIAFFVSDFINNSLPNTKIGGLLAISSVAIALDKDANQYVEDIIRPIFSCALDSSRDVRYRALEAMYNVIKSVRASIMPYLDETFDTVIRMCEDTDMSIREASNLVDKLIKDIIIENPTFNIVTLIEIIRERIYALTANTRKMILSWIAFLDSVPDIDMLIFIQDILDGLLKISCDANKDIRRAAEAILCEFFEKIKEDHEKVEFKPLIKILLIHVQTDSYLVQNISLQWLCECIKLANCFDILHNSAHILAAILPCLSYARLDSGHHDGDNDDANKQLQKKNTELSKGLNEDLMNLVTKFKYEKADSPKGATIKPLDDAFDQLAVNGPKHGSKTMSEESFNISKILIVLVNELELGPKTSTQTKIAILEWILQIYTNLEINIDDSLELKLLNILLNTLPDTSDGVVLMDLKVLGKIIFKAPTAAGEDDYRNCKKLINPLVDLFYQNSGILKERGSFIICQLCTIMDAPKVYMSFSEILLSYDHKFIHSMVYILNTILLTSKELSSLRSALKTMANNKESVRLFSFLYKTWAHSAVSAVSLCLLTKCYRHTSELIMHFGNMHITIDILMEIDQLIQLLESPIFTSLRLDLLEADKSFYLRKSLNGLLMLLPQSEAFHILRKRLQCVPIHSDRPKDESKSKGDELSKQIDFKQLLEYYVKVQKSLETSSTA